MPKAKSGAIGLAVAVALTVMLVVASGCTSTAPPTTTPTTPPATTPSATPPPSTPTTPPATGADLGKLIWETGADNAGALAFTGGLANTKSAACSKCHGDNGKGKKGLGPDIRGSVLKPDFNVATFGRAVTKGLDEKGKPLDKKMPHIDATPEDIAALWLFVNTVLK